MHARRGDENARVLVGEQAAAVTDGQTLEEHSGSFQLDDGACAAAVKDGIVLAHKSERFPDGEGTVVDAAAEDDGITGRGLFHCRGESIRRVLRRDDKSGRPRRAGQNAAKGEGGDDRRILFRVSLLGGRVGLRTWLARV